MTRCDTEKLAGSPCQEPVKIGSLLRMLPKKSREHRLVITSSSIPRNWFRCVAVSLACAMCVTTSALSPTNSTLFAQPPSVESPQVPTDGTTAAPSEVPSPLNDLDFDIDLGTEEFENFGEEDFKVEEANYFRDTVVPIAIKVAIGAAVILLLAWVATKLAKPKQPPSTE